MRQLILIILLGFSATTLQAQIGINTDSPLALFHIDGAKDNSASPTAAQISNDVVVTSAGSIGVGTHTPIVKLDIAASATGIKPLRIVDGTTFSNKVLESDADGAAKWTQQPPSYAKNYRATQFGQTFKNSVRTLLTLDQQITIPQNGKYLLTLRWWGYNLLNVNGNVLSGYIYAALVGSGDLDQVEYYMVGDAGDILTFTTSFYLGDRVTGDRIVIYVLPQVGGTIGSNQWQLISNTARADLMPQVILYSI